MDIELCVLKEYRFGFVVDRATRSKHRYVVACNDARAAVVFRGGWTVVACKGMWYPIVFGWVRWTSSEFQVVADRA